MKVRSKTLCLALGCLLMAVMAQAQSRELLEFPGTWSWEESIAAVDIVQFAQSQSPGTVSVIDEKTFRGLLENVISRVLARVESEGQASELETVLREQLLYFTPEYEYYWPAYSQALRIIRWPIAIEAAESEQGTKSITFRLGRPLDDERALTVSINRDQLADVLLKRVRYAGTEPRLQTLRVALTPSEVEFTVDDGDGQEPRRLVGDEGFRYVGTRNGIELLLEPHPSDSYSPSVEVYDPRATGQVFEIVRSLIALASEQLDLQGRDQELERVLRQQFFEFNPWQPLSEEAALAFLEPAYELVSIRTLSQANDVNLVYRWSIGNVYRRVLTVTLVRSNTPEVGLSLTEIVFKRPVAFAIDELGEETRTIYFEQDSSLGFGAVFAKFVADPQGHVNTPADEQVIARF